jgi:hypothetical protein
MKNSRAILWLTFILVLGGGLAWVFWPKETPVADTKPALANIAPKVESTAKVVTPKPANAPLVAAASGLAPHSPPMATTPDTAARQAIRDAERQSMEKLMKSQTEALLRGLNAATNDADREAISNQLTYVRRTMQAQIDLLSEPVLPPVDLGAVALAEGIPVKQPLNDGGTVTLRLEGSPKGEWQVNVMVWHSYAEGGSGIHVSVPAISGQPTTVNIREYEIHFTPQVPPGPAPITTPIPPPPVD